MAIGMFSNIRPQAFRISSLQSVFPNKVNISAINEIIFIITATTIKTKPT